MKYFVYIVKCCDDTLYTGITTDIERRVSEHNGDCKGAKYTKMRQPVQLVYEAAFPDRSSASSEEYKIKQMTRKQKELIIIENNKSV